MLSRDVLATLATHAELVHDVTATGCLAPNDSTNGRVVETSKCRT